MKYNDENKMTPKEMQAEIARYQLEEQEREEELKIKVQEQMCWEEYTARKQAEENKAVFEAALYMLSDEDIPVKDEDIEEEIKEILDELYKEEEKELENDPFVEMSEYKNPHNGISYRRKQKRRLRRALINKAVASDRELVQRSGEDRKNYKPSVRMPVEKKPEDGETRKHCECMKYNRSYKSQAARAQSLKKAVMRFDPDFNLGQKNVSMA